MPLRCSTSYCEPAVVPPISTRKIEPVENVTSPVLVSVPALAPGARMPAFWTITLPTVPVPPSSAGGTSPNPSVTRTVPTVPSTRSVPLRTTVPTAGLSAPVTVQVAASPLTSTEKSPPTLPRSNVPLPEVPERRTVSSLPLPSRLPVMTAVGLRSTVLLDDALPNWIAGPLVPVTVPVTTIVVVPSAVSMPRAPVIEPATSMRLVPPMAPLLAIDKPALSGVSA